MTSFSVVFIALYAAHMVADHWVQTQGQSDRKVLPGWVGRRSCAAHIGTYTLTAVVALGLLVWRTGLHLNPGPVLAGLVLSAASHYLADRRKPLRRLADRLGKSPVWLDQHGGMYALDQSWHIGWLFLAALVIS